MLLEPDLLFQGETTYQQMSTFKHLLTDELLFKYISS